MVSIPTGCRPAGISSGSSLVWLEKSHTESPPGLVTVPSDTKKPPSWTMNKLPVQFAHGWPLRNVMDPVSRAKKAPVSGRGALRSDMSISEDDMAPQLVTTALLTSGTWKLFNRHSARSQTRCH